MNIITTMAVHYNGLVCVKRKSFVCILLCCMLLAVSGIAFNMFSFTAEPP